LDIHGSNNQLNILRLLFANQPSVTENFRNHAVESRGTALRAGHHRLDPVMVFAEELMKLLSS
jgi:mRNA-degrading endonuclease YafQ of YafQ-DinJ toxin-antitoxin module